MAFLIAVAIVSLGILDGSSAFAASQRMAGNNSQPIRGSAGSCNWGGYYANNQCVWYDIDDAQGLPHTHWAVGTICIDAKDVALSKQLSRAEWVYGHAMRQ